MESILPSSTQDIVNMNEHKNHIQHCVLTINCVAQSPSLCAKHVTSSSGTV